VFVTGYYGAALTLYNTGGGTGATLPFTGGYDAFLAKYSSAGSVLWAAQIASIYNDVGQAVATDSSGNVFVTGWYNSAALTLYNAGGGTGATLTNAGNNDCFLAKYSSAGSVVWATQIASTSVTSDDRGYGVATDSSGNVFVTGQYSVGLTLYNTGGGTGATLPSTNSIDIFIAKYSSTGTVAWAARIAQGTNSSEFAFAVATDSSGNVFVTGEYISAPLNFYNAAGTLAAQLPNATSTGDIFLTKYSSTGAVVWVAQIAGAGNDIGQGVATDSSGNVFVTGQYGAALTLYNTGGGTGATLPFTGGQDAFLAKYSSAGSVLWAAQLAGTSNDVGYGVATDSSGNVFVTGYYQAALTLYNTGGGTGASLAFTGAVDGFLAKYSSAGSVVWAAQISSVSNQNGIAVATDSSGNVFVSGRYYNTALTLYDTGGSTSTTLANAGGQDVFLAKYSSAGFITGNSAYFTYSGGYPASSNVLVDGTYTSSSFSPYVSGSNVTALSGTVAAATGLFIGGPSNYFNGSLSELLVYAATLTTSQRQALEGYLTWKWNLRSSFLVSHPLYATPPFMQAFRPIDITGCRLWMDAADPSTMNSLTTVTSWSDKSGSNNTMTGTATYSAGTMTFNGTNQAFSNTGFVFPNTAYSMFAVYSNTTAPASAAYMNLMYGNGGYPMLGTFDTTKAVTARSVVGNVGGLGQTATATANGWAVQIAGLGNDVGRAVATDSSGNVFVTGLYAAACTLYNTGGTTGATLANTGGNDCFLAKYSSAGSVLWATRIAGTTASDDRGYGVATDSSGNVFVTGSYTAALTLYNTGGGTGASLAYTGGNDCFLAKYSSAGSVLWATRIASTGDDVGYGVATDSSGNVFVTGYYNAALTLYNTGGGTGATLAVTGGYDCFLAKYSSAGSVVWAAQIASTGTDQGNGVSTDSSGNVFVTGYYNAALTLYNTGGTTGATLAVTGGYDVFLAKYSSAGSVVWAAQIAGTGTDYGYGVATDSSGNVFVTGSYTAALTLYNTGGTTGATLAVTGGYDVFLAKYSSAGSVVWATRIASTGTDQGYGVATDSSGNVFVTGYYSAACTLYNTGGGTGATLAFAGVTDVFLAKYSSAGSVLWAAQIGSTASDPGYGVATDSSGNVFVTGNYGAALTLYDTGGTTSTTLAFTGGVDAFLAKYSPTGFISGTYNVYSGGYPASSNVLVDGTYTPSSFSPYVNGSNVTALSGTTAAATGLFIGGPTNYFNGSLSELVIYAATLTTAQRQLLEGYLANKWGLNSSLISTQPYKTYAFPITSTVSSNFTIS
jgi:hypothetical protein